MATGGAYANPDVNVGVDRQSGQVIGNAIASIGQNIGAGIEKKQQRDDIAAERRRKEAEKARIRAEQNWQISKQVESQKTQEVMEFQATLKANNIDMDSLDGSFRSVIDEMYAAKSRLAQSRSDYDGRKEDEAAIRNGQAFIGSIGEKFQTMNMLTSTWKEKFKTRNVPGGIDDSSSDPLFAAMMNIGEGDGEGINAGSVGWERRTGPGGKIQLFQVADSPMIRELNNGKPYELSYDQVSGFLNDDDNNPNTFGPFSLVPDHTKEINEAGKSSGIFLDGGAINKEQFYSKGTEYVAVDGLGGAYGEQLSWPNTAAMQGALGQMSKSAAQAELGFGGSSVTANSNIRANALSRTKKVDGKEVTEYYFPTFGERDPQTGEIKETGEVILGDSMSGLMTQNNEDGTQETDGYSKEEYDNYLKFTDYMYMSQNGAYANPEAIASEKRDYINKPTGGGPKSDEEIGKEYYKAFEDDPVKLWQTKTDDRDAKMLIDEETGEQTNTILSGGNTASPSYTAAPATINYDGSSWSTIPGLATGRYQSASGTGSPTNVLCVSGRNPGWVTTVEEYNKSTNTITGAAWASGGALPTAVYDNAGAGTQTAGLSFGGDTAPDDKTTATFEYDGSSWTAGGALNTGRRELGGFGTQTAAVAACGGNYPASTLSEEYNGSSWTAGNPTSVARTMMGAAGVLTSGLVCGGNPGTITTTEEYDGTNWSSGGALPVGKQSNDSFGNIVTAIRNVGGNAATPTNYVNTSESYDGTNWTSGPTMTYGADRVTATGSSTSGLVFSGRLGPS
jgi:hypothetical protein